MNSGSSNQMRSVAGSCKHFNNKGINVQPSDISCGICKNWDGVKCSIGAFDKVLTSLDQT